MDPHAIRNFRDFLLQYNRISESCFMQCVTDLSRRYLVKDEADCVENCAYKHVKMNNRAMQVYVEIQPALTQKRIEEANKQAELATAKELAEAPKEPEKIESSDKVAS